MNLKTPELRCLRCLAFLLLMLFLCPKAALAEVDRFQSRELNDGYRDMYNLDFPAAHQEFALWMSAHPEDPWGPLSDAAAYLFTEFDRLGVLDIQLFADDSRFVRFKPPAPDPATRASFDLRWKSADDLADKALAQNPADAWALFAKALVCGLRADYDEMIDDSNLSALRLTQKSSKFAALALRAKPDLYDAHLASGMENYMLSLRPAPIRWIVGLTGGSTNRDTGIREVRIVAEHGHFLQPFARLMLAVAELRQGNKEQARSLLAGLAKDYPRNALYATQLRRIH